MSRRDNSLALQQRFLRLVEAQLLPRLQDVFDRLAGPDEWIELDKLEIDLGYLAPDESDQIWLDKAFLAYTAALERKLVKRETHRATTTAQNVDLLAFFLTHGSLPWWAVGEKMETLVRRQLPALVARLPNLLKNMTARRRWVRQFDDSIQLEAFVGAAAKISGAIGPEYLLPLSLQQWLSLFPDTLHREFRNIYWESLWEALGFYEGFPGHWLQGLLQHAFSRVPDMAHLEQMLEQNLRSAIMAKFPEMVKEQWIGTLAGELSRRLRQVTHRERKRHLQNIRRLLRRHVVGASGEQSRLIGALEQTITAFEDGIVLPDEVRRLPATAAPDPDLPLVPKQSTPGPDPEGMFVPLAGIVLIHPFLPAFFERLGLLTDGQFQNEAAQERAVHLLYHAATGLQYPSEVELPLLKLLCGFDIETPVEREIDLNETEQIESLQLLQALTREWTALEGVAPDELRGSFFIRDGKLRRGDMGWHLTVETKPWDILLAKLPWGLSPILHRWMKEMLWVDWA